MPSILINTIAIAASSFALCGAAIAVAYKKPTTAAPPAIFPSLDPIADMIAALVKRQRHKSMIMNKQLVHVGGGAPSADDIDDIINYLLDKAIELYNKIVPILKAKDDDVERRKYHRNYKPDDAWIPWSPWSQWIPGYINTQVIWWSTKFLIFPALILCVVFPVNMVASAFIIYTFLVYSAWAILDFFE